jgi:phospho-N-acetylmuramoyl-pentapeptide-transferase
MKALVAIKSSQIIQKEIEEHKQKQGTPTMGGLIVFAGLAGGTAAVGGASFIPAWIILAAFGVIGFLDDYLVPKVKEGSRGFDWKPKLALQVIGATAALWLSGWTDPLALAFGVFVILFFSNAYNFSDGLDGLAGGLGMLLSAGLIGLILMRPTEGSMSVVPVLAVLAAGLIPFLFFNAAPARVFMGDVGALPFGALLGWAALMTGREANGSLAWAQALPLLVLSLVMLAEIIPPPLQVLSVKLRGGKRLFPFKTPIHHGFQSAGWPETRVVTMFHLVQLACVMAAWLILWSSRS